MWTMDNFGEVCGGGGWESKTCNFFPKPLAEESEFPSLCALLRVTVVCCVLVSAAMRSVHSTTQHKKNCAAKQFVCAYLCIYLRTHSTLPLLYGVELYCIKVCCLKKKSKLYPILLTGVTLCELLERTLSGDTASKREVVLRYLHAGRNTTPTHVPVCSLSCGSPAHHQKASVS